jgi:hypothetical protein
MPARALLAVSLLLIPASMLSGAAAQSSQGGPAQRLSVELGRADREIVLQPGISDILQLPRPARTIIIGNPAIADATLNGDTAVVLTGQKVGQTNLIILDASGMEVTRTALRVGPQESKVVIRHGTARQSYTCNPTCTVDPSADTRVTQYSGPWGTSTVVTTTGETPPGLMTPPVPPQAPPQPR